MTPKDKANELHTKMVLVKDGLHEYTMCFDTAKQCALIAVDEIIKYLPNINNTPPIRRNEECFYFQYWVGVKQEIEKL